MTFKELLDSVTFDEVVPHIMILDPMSKDSLGWFKLHFDMLRLLKPKYHEDANDDVCHITLEELDDGSGSRLNAYPMEGDWWEHSLTKEIVLDANVHATNAEIAACCLWHTSFHGFISEQIKESLQFDYKPKVNELKTVIQRHGGHVPSKSELSVSAKQELIKGAKNKFWYGDKPANKAKRKRHFRHVFMEEYYERMVTIGRFIVKVLPALSACSIAIEQLCDLFNAETFASVTIPSFADAMTDAAIYLTDIISTYDMLPQAENVIIYLATGYRSEEPPTDNSQEFNLLLTIIDKVINHVEGRVDVILGYNPSLGNQIEVTVCGYR